ncbi:MAG: 2-hydroxychromene-2-carboxylate isomerase [Candidatus Lambdaproteobacteria bacterium]|nr:2-hydroxychromene-2-carboxylate isomerase [Candidatus Lambdaproteobacteria bacterium]
MHVERTSIPAAMSQTTVTFYFDYGSPYSYIASRQIEEICRRHRAELRWEPIVLGGLFKEAGITAPYGNPTKRPYVLEDLRNLTEMLGIPYRERTEFLFNPVLAERATLQVPPGDERVRAVHALFRGAWAENLDLASPEVVERLLTGAGLNGKSLVAGTQRQEVKDVLKRSTDEAIRLGAFGAPTFVLNGTRLFWGQDRLAVLDYFMGKLGSGAAARPG